MKIKKNLFAKTAGVLALALLMLAACGGDSGGGGGGSLGDVPLELSGTVYTVGEGAEMFAPPVYEKMTAAGPYSFTITTSPGSIGSTGDITNGTLKLTANTPAAADLVPASTLMSMGEFAYFDNVTADPATVNAAELAPLSVTIDGTVYSVSKEKETGKQSETSASMKSESVTYIYVDNDVTVSANGKTSTVEGFMTVTTKNTTLNLKKGWNAIYVSSSGSFNMSGGTMTGSAKVSNPALQWTAED